MDSLPFVLHPTGPSSLGGPFSFAWEKLDDCLRDGVEDLLIEDWEEIEGDAKCGVPYAPDFDRFRQFERADSLKILVVRHDCQIIGYNAFTVTPRLFSKHWLEAYNNVIYGAKPWRAMIGLQLIRQAEKGLREMGVKRIRYDTKTHLGCLYSPTGGRLGALLNAEGYEHVESGYAKRL